MSSGVPEHDARFLADLDVAVDLPLASVGSRVLAQIVDLLLLGIIALVAIPTMTWAAGAFVPRGWMGFMVALGLGLMFLMQWGYFFTWEVLLQGQSAGKRLFGLRVVHADGTGVGLTASLIRNLLRPIDFLPMGYGVGTIVMFVTRRSQRIGDLAAGTLVVREPEPAVAGAPPDRWPDRFSTEDASLIEAFFAREGLLLPERREELASGLLEWLRRDHPDFVGPIPEGRAASEVLAEVFHTRGPMHRLRLF